MCYQKYNKNVKENILICPICKNNLTQNLHSLSCNLRHCFDISKEGYINLLLVNQKKTNDPGDNKETVVARQNFLNKGYYFPLAKEISNITKVFCDSNSIILDAGCGTGFYLSNIDCGSQKIGIDISKHAIKIAAKKYQAIRFIVASIFNLPIKENSIDCILNIFAPKANDEFMRVLKQKGIIVEVIPGKLHLVELKKCLYNELHYNRTDVKKFDTQCISEHQLTYKQNIGHNDLIQLFDMTPYAFKTSQNDKEKLDKIDNMDITFDFIIKIWRKI